MLKRDGISGSLSWVNKGRAVLLAGAVTRYFSPPPSKMKMRSPHIIPLSNQSLGHFPSGDPAENHGFG